MSDLLEHWVLDARQRTLDLIADLSDEQLVARPLPTVNPLLWEIGHIAWFYETWVLCHAGGQSPLRGNADRLYDSSVVPHSTRWDLPLLRRRQALEYLCVTQEKVLEVIRRGPTPLESNLISLSVFHEDMHGEAFLITRQTYGNSRPQLSSVSNRVPHPAGPWPGDVEVAGGVFSLGAGEKPFVFDNELQPHPVEGATFRMARAPVTQAEFAAFVDDGGYTRREFWDEHGWQWRTSATATEPIYWKRQGGAWLRRDFDRWLPLEPHHPMIHVNWHEATAYCRWAGRRLPTEAEWELAATGATSGAKRRFPWGDAMRDNAQLDANEFGACDVAAFPEGDSTAGCRQMIGNVWEWTASDFLPYPGFVAGLYRDYSQPWFGTHKVLRGGAWPTRSRLIDNTYRNFYTPDRRDIWAGFRTCALEGRG